MHELCEPLINPTVGRLEVAVLDWAGTAVDFGSRAPVAAILAAFEQAGVPVTAEEARRPMGRAKRDHLKALLEQREVAERWLAARGAASTEADIDAIYADFLKLQAETVASHSAVITGCVEAVAACRELGIRIGSSTGYTRDLLAPVARRAKDEGYEPEVALSADDVSPGRPAPWLCIENARRLEASAMAAVVKVDDTPAGVLAGRNAGAWAVGVVVSGNEVGLSETAWSNLSDSDRDARRAAAAERLTAAGAHYLVDTIADLPEVVVSINQRLADGDRS